MGLNRKERRELKIKKDQEKREYRRKIKEWIRNGKDVLPMRVKSDYQRWISPDD